MKKQSLKIWFRSVILFSITTFACTQNNTKGIDVPTNYTDSARDHTNTDNNVVPPDSLPGHRNKSANTGDAEADHNTSTPGMPATATPAASGHK